MDGPHHFCAKSEGSEGHEILSATDSEVTLLLAQTI